MLEGSCLSDYSAGKREERERLLWRGNCREAKDKADIKTAGLTCHDAAVAVVCTLSLTVLVVLVVGVVVVRRWSTSSSLTNPPLTNSSLETTSNFQFACTVQYSQSIQRILEDLTLFLLWNCYFTAIYALSSFPFPFFYPHKSCRLTIVMSANNSAGSVNAWDDDWEKQADVCFLLYFAATELSFKQNILLNQVLTGGFADFGR